MSSVTQPPRFLGLELGSLGRELRAAWQQIRGWPGLTLLSPPVPVRLLRADGRADLWMVDEADARPARGDVSAARYDAVELPEDDWLLRRIELPPLPAAEVAQAVALEVAGASPFAPDDLVWGYSSRRVASGKIEIDIALASRKRSAAYLQTLASRPPTAGAAEVWAMAPSAPVVFNGFGETQRMAHARMRQRMALALLLLALGLVAAIAVTPVAQARLRAVQAVQASNELTKRVEPLIRQRAALMRNVENGQALQEALADRADPLVVMDLLTRVLSDETSLLGLNIQGSKVSITGSTPNAAALMQELSARPELREVKAPVPATRPLGTSKDSFNIEFSLAGPPATPKAAASAPAVPIGTAAAAGSPAASAAASAEAVAVAPPLPASASGAASHAQPSAQPMAQPAPQPATQSAPSSGASFGGATFGAPSKPAKAP